MSKPRHVRPIRNGRNRAAEPVRKRELIALLKTMKPLREEFREFDDPVPAVETMPASSNASAD